MTWSAKCRRCSALAPGLPSIPASSPGPPGVAALLVLEGVGVGWGAPGLWAQSPVLTSQLGCALIGQLSAGSALGLLPGLMLSPQLELSSQTVT